MNSYQRNFNNVMYLVCDMLHRGSFSRRLHGHNNIKLVKYMGMAIKPVKIEKILINLYPFLASKISIHIQSSIDILVDERVLMQNGKGSYTLNALDGRYRKSSENNLSTIAYEIYQIAEDYVTSLQFGFRRNL